MTPSGNVYTKRILGRRTCRKCGVSFIYDDARVRHCMDCRKTMGSPFRLQLTEDERDTLRGAVNTKRLDLYAECGDQWDYEVESDPEPWQVESDYCREQRHEDTVLERILKKLNRP